VTATMSVGHDQRIAPDSPAIEFESVSKLYGSMPALEDVSFRLEQGQTMGFLGPNGAGKTTSIRLALDFIRPTSGNVTLLGLDCHRQSQTVRTHVGYLPGELHMYEDMTGSSLIRYFSDLRPGRVQETYLCSLLDRLELDPTKRVSAYSKGNKQKLGLVIALMHQPSVLLLDEPTSGLDPLVQETVADLLAEATHRGTSVLLSSHVLSEVERLCHRVLFLRNGRLIATEDVADLKARSLHILEATFSQAPPADAFEFPGVREIERYDTTVQLEVHDQLDAVLKAISRYEVLDLRTEQPSLEQVFLAYYGGNHGLP